MPEQNIRRPFYQSIRFTILLPYVVALCVLLLSTILTFHQLQKTQINEIDRHYRAHLEKAFAPSKLEISPSALGAEIDPITGLDLTVSEFAPTPHQTIETSGEKQYLRSVIPLQNVAGKQSGYLHYKIDITEHMLNQQKLLDTFFCIVLAFGLILLAFYFAYTGKIQIRLNRAYVNLEKENRKRKNAETTLEAQYKTLFEQSADALVIMDEAGVIDCNMAAVHMLGHPDRPSFLQLPYLNLSPELQPNGQLSTVFLNEMMKTAYEQGSLRFEWIAKRANGETFPVEVLFTAITSDDQKKLHAVWRDITERKLSAEEVEYHAYYDDLTGLPNRSLFRDRLSRAVIRAKRKEIQGAVLFLDLDHFKNINDSLGHSAGDALLQETAKRLIACLRGEDTAARLGGDEFVILLSESDHETPLSIGAKVVAEKIRKALREPFMIESNELHISGSIGITIFPSSDHHFDTDDDILRQADTAMYSAKEKGRNEIAFYLPEMQAEIVKRLTMEKDLRKALEQKQLYLSYQPQISENHQVEGVEALLRWRNPETGEISPAEFIPFAEENGLIVPIGEWVLEQAIRDILPLLEKTPHLRHVSVNVSARQFQQSDFTDVVIGLIERLSIPPGFLFLEITESVVMEDTEDTIKKMMELKARGVQISMDDFGTGYSSLTYLKRLPIDELKIDQSFIKDIDVDKNDAALVETIISMAQHLELDIIAEGVETQQQVEFLEQRGCHKFQGYFFSHPLTIEALRVWILEQCNSTP